MSCISATELSATFCLANILNAMAFPLDKQAGFIIISWQNETKKEKKRLVLWISCREFWWQKRTVAIWLCVFYDTGKEIDRKLVEPVENLYKYKMQQANSLSTVYSGSTYSDNGQGACLGWYVSWPLPHIASL